MKAASRGVDASVDSARWLLSMCTVNPQPLHATANAATAAAATTLSRMLREREGGGTVVTRIPSHLDTPEQQGANNYNVA